MELSGAFLEPGFPPLSAVLDRYARVSGRGLAALGWYAAMAAWKMAVLYDFSHRQGKDAYYADPEQSQRFLAMAQRMATTDLLAAGA